jgi:hypothetical protein
MSVTRELVRKVNLNFIAVDTSVSCLGESDVSVITVRKVIGIINPPVNDHDIETIMEVDVSGLDLGATE